MFAATLTTLSVVERPLRKKHEIPSAAPTPHELSAIGPSTDILRNGRITSQKMSMPNAERTRAAMLSKIGIRLTTDEQLIIIVAPRRLHKC